MRFGNWFQMVRCGCWNQGQSSVFCHFELFFNVLWIYTLCSKTGKSGCVYYLSIAGLADPPQIREIKFLPRIWNLGLCLSLWNNQVTFLGNSGESAKLLTPLCINQFPFLYSAFKNESLSACGRKDFMGSIRMVTDSRLLGRTGIKKSRAHSWIYTFQPLCQWYQCTSFAHFWVLRNLLVFNISFFLYAGYTQIWLGNTGLVLTSFSLTVEWKMLTADCYQTWILWQK